MKAPHTFAPGVLVRQRGRRKPARAWPAVLVVAAATALAVWAVLAWGGIA